MFKKLASFTNKIASNASRMLISKEGLLSFYRDSFYRNAGYLIADSLVDAVAGFIFWIVATRLYSAEKVGLNSSLVSIAGLISFLGTLGLGYGVIRFLPDSDNKVRLLNSSLTFSLFAALAAGLIFVFGLPLWSPKLVFVRGDPFLFAAFVIFVVAGTLLQIASYTLIAFRRADFILFGSLISRFVQFSLAIGLAFSLKTFGIFTSNVVANVILVVVFLFVFIPMVLPRYHPLPTMQKKVSNELLRFSLANYLSDTLGGLPTWILPLMVINILSAEIGAYFFISWSMISILQAIPIATSMSLLSEGSYLEGKFSSSIRKSFKLLALILIPAVIIMVLLGDKLLLLFGRQYSSGGTYLLRLLAPASLPASINTICISIARVEKKLKTIVMINGAISFGTLILSYLFLHILGILGVGVAWLTTQTVVALVNLFSLKKRREIRP